MYFLLKIGDVPASHVGFPGNIVLFRQVLGLQHNHVYVYRLSREGNWSSNPLFLRLSMLSGFLEFWDHASTKMSWHVLEWIQIQKGRNTKVYLWVMRWTWFQNFMALSRNTPSRTSVPWHGDSEKHQAKNKSLGRQQSCHNDHLRKETRKLL